MILMMSPLPAHGKGLDRSARLAELTGFVGAAARDGLPAHELERGLWPYWLRPGHDVQAEYFALAGDGDGGETLTPADGQVVKRLPEHHPRPYPSILGDFVLDRVVYGTREGRRIGAAPPDARLGLPEDPCAFLPRDGLRSWVVENPYGQANAVPERLLGRKRSAASLETMTRTLAGAVAGQEATRPAAVPAPGGQIVVLSAAGQGVPLRGPADAPAIAAPDPARGPEPDRQKRAVPGRGPSRRAAFPHRRGGGRVAVSRADGPAGTTRSAPASSPAPAGGCGAAGRRRRGRRARRT